MALRTTKDSGRGSEELSDLKLNMLPRMCNLTYFYKVFGSARSKDFFFGNAIAACLD